MFFVLFPQESLCRDAGHSVHSSVLVVKTDRHLHNINELSTDDNKVANGPVLGRFTQTVHMLIVETE